MSLFPTIIAVVIAACTTVSLVVADIPDRDWSFNSFDVIPSSTPQATGTIATITIKMISTPSLAECRFYSHRGANDSLRVVWNNVTYDNVTPGTELDPYAAAPAPPELTTCSYIAYGPGENRTEGTLGCYHGHFCSFSVTGEKDTIPQMTYFDDQPRFFCIFASQRNQSLQYQSSIMTARYPNQTFDAECAIPANVPDLDLILVDAMIAYNPEGKWAWAVNKTFGTSVAASSFHINSSIWTIGTPTVDLKGELSVKGALSAPDQYYFVINKVGNTTTTYCSGMYTGVSIESLSWSMATSGNDMISFLNLHCNDTLQVSLMWLSSKPGSVALPVAYYDNHGSVSYSWTVTWTQPDASPSTDENGSKFPTLVVIGCAAGGVLLFVIIGCCMCRKKKEESINFTTDDEERGYRQIGHPHGRK